MNFTFKSLDKKSMNPFSVYLKTKLDKSKSVNSNSIREFLEKMFYFIDFNLLPMYKNEIDIETDYNYSSYGSAYHDVERRSSLSGEPDERMELEFNEFYIFMWCVLTNRLEVAKIFWRLGKV